MKQFLDHNFLLSNPTAERLYHEFAAPMPIIDYHNHLPPAQIASNINFDNITQAWLYGDHYKWRAMRTNGVDEKYCTGNASDFEKFGQWAATVPYTMRNPLYHWTHLELQRYFGVTTLLNSDTAAGIYDHCSAQLQQPSHSVHGLLQLFNVKIICTTDDPVDDLAHHQQISRNNRGIKVFPAFRPDKAMDVADATAFNQYLGRLEAAANISISNFNDYITALRQRHDYFAANGCCVSDHGLEQIIPVPYTIEEVTVAFARIRGGQSLSADEQLRFRSCMLEFFAEWDWEKGWVQQYHLGALRNTNSRMLRLLGPDTGWDSIGDFSQASGLAAFLNRLDNQNKLAKTIVYNLNPADNELMATMTGNFNDGSVAAKVQLGAAWWFLDQKDGITRQINALSNMGLLSRSVGMLTDSRSFLSFPRHEYFRRLLCNLLGEEVMQGELPNDIDWLGKMVQDICYHNVYHYFNWKQ